MKENKNAGVLNNGLSTEDLNQVQGGAIQDSTVVKENGSRKCGGKDIPCRDNERKDGPEKKDEPWGMGHGW